jgi:predicted HTH domain antitoxin
VNLDETRLEEGLQAFIQGEGSIGSTEAARIAGVPRAEFLQILIDRGISMMHGPWSLAAELESMARYLGDEELAAVAAALAPHDD